MKHFLTAAMTVFLIGAAVRAQDPAPKTPPPVAPAPAARKDTARTFEEEFKRGYDLLIAEKWAEGMAVMHRCLELSPEYPLCAYNLACAHARQAQIEEGIGWFQKAVAWGFGYDALRDAIAESEKDQDLDPLRADPRFVAAMTTARANAKRIEEYVATPSVYVPEALAGAAQVPVLVVLHTSGATKESVVTGRWKSVADELGLALVAPSARVMTGREPKAGMAWFLSVADYANATRSPVYEQSVTSAIDAFKQKHRIDPTRVYIAGDVEGGLVALRLAFAKPDLYKGVVACESGLMSNMLRDKAAAAAKSGLKVKLLLDRDSFARRIAADPSAKVDAETALAAWSDELAKMGFAGALAATPKGTETATSDAATQRIVTALRAMQPAAVEAGAPK